MKRPTTIVDEERLVEWLRELVRRPSEQSELFERDPAVQAFIADCVRPMLARENLNGRLDAMGNLLVEIGPTNARRKAMLLAYSMTHPASSMKDPFAAQLLETSGARSVRGRGVAEQKGALAAAIAAFVALARNEPRARIALAVSTAGETGQHKAAESILAALGWVPDVAIVAIGTGGRIALANKGRVDIHLEVSGKASHSSTPWLGMDAIAGARAVMDKLQNLDLGPEQHPMLGRPTLVPTAIRSYPEATHTIQDRVSLTYDRRLLPGQDPVAAVEAVRKALTGIAPWRIAVRAGALQYPAEIPAEGHFMRCARQGAQRLGLPVPETFASHGCVDAGLLVRHGCEAAMWGPGEQAMWHTDDEQLHIGALTRGAASYLGFLQEFCS